MVSDGQVLENVPGKGLEENADLFVRLLDECRIAIGADGQLAPENVLAARFGVSRTTLRESLAVLEHKGLIRRRPRAGTAVSPIVAEPIVLLDHQADYMDMLRSAGVIEPRVEVLLVDWSPEPIEGLEALPGETHVRVVKRWMAGQEICMVADNHQLVPEALVGATDAIAESAFDIVGHDRRIEWVNAYPDAVVVSGREARWCGVADGTPMLREDLEGLDGEHRTLLIANEFYVSRRYRLGHSRPVARRRSTPPGG